MTKEHLVAIATRLFAENGYSGTSLDSIAEQAGIHRASLLHHFKSKKALYGAVLGDLLKVLYDFIRDAGQINGDFTEALDQLATRIVHYFGAHPGIARILVRELVDGGPYFKGPGQQAVLDILKVTTDFLQAGMDAGTFRQQDAKQLAFSIIGVHLYYFSATPSTERYLGKGAYAKAGIERRRKAVLSHVRSLCLEEKE